MLFRSLATLAVEGDWTDVESLLNAISLPSMHTLIVTAYDNGRPAAQLAAGASKCFDAIASRHQSISKLSIPTDFGRLPPSRGCVVHAIPIVTDAFEGKLIDVIGTLLSLHAITNLSIIFPAYFNLSCASSDYLLMAKA